LWRNVVGIVRVLQELVREVGVPVKVLDSNKARTRWREILDSASAGTVDVIVERYGKPVVAVIAYHDYVAFQEEVDDRRTARRAAEAYEAWKQDPTLARPWDEIEAELVADGLLDDAS
jgi:prevent-host-death family protein